MRILALVTDAFGGYGGIALYNRDFLKSLCVHPKVTEVVAIARCAAEHSDKYPVGLKYDVSGISNAHSFLKAIIRNLINNQKFDLIICCHINLMPLAWLIGKLLRKPVVLEIYGIEAWQPTGRWMSDYLSASAKIVISISEYTRVRYLSWSKLSDEKCKLLPNAIHAEKYGIGLKSEKLIKRYGLQGKKCLLTFGRIVSKERAKGFDEVLELLPELLKIGRAHV